MRGLTKAAALLSSAIAPACAVLDPPASGNDLWSPPVVEYHASEAILFFDIAKFGRDEAPRTNFSLEIDASAEPCTNSSIRFQGKQLQSTWNGDSYHGHGSFPSIYSPIVANWHIFCHGPVGDSSSFRSQHVVQILTVAVHRLGRHPEVGFTVSYDQVGAPKVLAFRPEPLDKKAIDSEPEFWRLPSGIGSGSQPNEVQATGEANKDQDVAEPNVKSESEEVTKDSQVNKAEDSNKPYDYNQKMKQSVLSGPFHAVSDYIEHKLAVIKSTTAKMVQSCRHRVKALKTKVHSVITKLCPSQRKTKAIYVEAVRNQGESAIMHYTRTAESSSPTQSTQVIQEAEHDEADQLFDAPAPAQTRALHGPTSTSTSNTPLTTPSSSSINSPSLYTASIDSSSTYPTHSSIHSPPTPFHFIKLVFIALALFSLLSWIFIRLKDPRRRADRAARAEERRNRKLYRRAAWAHWWQTRICALRHKHCPRSQGTGTSDSWDEKRTRVFQQENILEAVCQADIAHLRASTRPRIPNTNSMSAAEEGRNLFIYDSDSEVGFTRRHQSFSGRSVSTLPGYESEGTQPPGYATEDISPDSSVVSTSPRISRDGLSSEGDWVAGKDIEGLDLGPGITRRVFPKGG